MINFDLIDDSETLTLNLVDDSEQINFSMTDYDDTEIKEEIQQVDDKVDNLSRYTHQQVNRIDGEINNINNEIDEIERDYALKSEIPTQLKQLSSDSTHRTVTDTQISNWNNKADISDIPDVSHFITKDVNNLTYYTTTANLARVALTGNYNDLNNKPNLSVYATNQALGNETTDRENADIGLQGQIDAITSSSDVKDIVGTYTELQNYDTSTLGNDDIIKVLQDSTHNDAMTYYRWVITGGTGSWQYIGQEGPYYTKSETEGLLNNKQDEITSSNKLSADLVDDTNQTNQFVTSSEKTTWNNKLDSSALTNYVKNTDYATSSVGGVVRVYSSDGFAMNNGVLIGSAKTYQQYNDGGTWMMVCKGTLENVITGKGLIADANYVHTDNNFTNADVTKLSGIEAGAEVNVQANWNEASSSSDAYIQNKPYIPKYYYGTCSTKNSTRAKVVVCPDFVLEEGATISVLFTNAQTYNGAPQLNVNGTGAITVQYKSGTSGIRYMWNAGAVIDFTYNGTYWIMHRSDLATTTYYGITKLSESIVSTSAALGLTPSAINTAMINIISGTPVYSSSATYDVGDKVRYTDNVWRCTTAIETAEAWNAEHWEIDATLQDQIYTKQDTLVSGTNIKTINNESLLGSGNITIQGGATDYSDLTNKPSINNVTLSGNKTLSDLGIQPSGSYATTTDLATKQNITDNSLTTTNKTIPSAINEVNSIAKGANQALSYANYSTMVTAFNSLDDDAYNVGQNVYVVTTEVPDLWVSSVESTSSTYTYVDDATIVSALQTNGYIQVGYYKLSMLETQKVDLTGYQTKIDNSHKLSADLVDDTSTTNKFVTSTDITNWNAKYDKPSGGIPDTDLSSAVQTSLGKADTAIQSLDSCILKDSGSAVQMVSLTSGTGTTALGVKSMSSASSYISFSSTGGWLGSYGVSSTKKPVYYNGVGYTLATTDDVPKVVTLSQADYDDLVSGGTVDADTYYFIEE